MNLRELFRSIEGDLLSAEDSVDEVYKETGRTDFDWGNPNQADFKFFLTGFADWVERELKTDNSPAVRAGAIRQIRDYVLKKTAGVFAGIDPLVFGTQLALRVRRPRGVQQGQTSLCGPASFIYSFAKAQPQLFAKFGLDLFFQGQGFLGTMEVQPSRAVLENYHLRVNKISWAVDYVTLVSLRQCTFFADTRGLGLLRGADETTFPGQLAQWLQQAGYSEVQDHTFFGKHQQKLVKAAAARLNQPMHLGQSSAEAAVKQDRMGHAAKSLKSASQALSRGSVVLFFVDGEVADALQAKLSGSLFERKQPTQLGKHHWMAIRKIEILGTAVNIKAFSWGQVYEGAFDMNSFLSRYNGYVSAAP